MDWDVRRWAEIDSTNLRLAEEARRGAPAGTVAVADHQSAGRGRLDRRWEAPPGSSLLMSVLLRPAGLPPERLGLVAAAVALAAADACEAVAGFRPGLKWPNDLVVGDAKLAGLLAEAAPGWVVVGLGLNLRRPAGGFGPGLDGPGVAAAEEAAGRPVDRDALLDALLASLEGHLGRWDDVARSYRRACTTLGRPVRVDLAGESFTGTAADVTDEGHLLVDVGACLRTVVAGDLVHLRALA